MSLLDLATSETARPRLRLLEVHRDVFILLLAFALLRSLGSELFFLETLFVLMATTLS